MKEGANAGTMNYKEIVAVIDDDEFVRRALVRMLTSAGLEVPPFPLLRTFLR